MSTSQKRIESSRLNGSRSKGPTTVAGKLISRKNAETHGFRSRRFLVPGEQEAEVEERIDEMLSSMGPRTEGERTLLLSAVQCSVIFERSLAAQAARIAANIDNADHRLETEAKGLLKRLFHSRQGPMETYGSEQYLSGGERVSYSPIPDDPEDPETLVSSLEPHGARVPADACGVGRAQSTPGAARSLASGPQVPGHSITREKSACRDLGPSGT